MCIHICVLVFVCVYTVCMIEVQEMKGEGDEMRERLRVEEAEKGVLWVIQVRRG